MNDRKVYLDHNATAPLRAGARGAMLAALDSANASSVHGPGRKARRLIEEARERISRFAGTAPDAVIFTSGGTEANALALRGTVFGALAAEARITRVFISAIEHESVRANAMALAEQVPGLKVSEIPVTADGVVDLAAFRLQLMQGKGRALVAIMAANNETGVVQPIAQVAKILCAEGGEAVHFHVDAVQAAGRMTLAFDDWGADTMSLSAHKIGGGQGVGALIVRDGAPLVPLMAGAQENGKRAGTQNAPGIAAFAAAVDEVDGTGEVERIVRLRDGFEDGLRELTGGEVVIFGQDSERVANTSNFAIPGLSAEAALIALDLEGVAISSGAACTSGTVKPSHVLAAMGVAEDLARGGLRVSFGWTNTQEDGDAALGALRHLLERKRRLNARVQGAQVPTLEPAAA